MSFQYAALPGNRWHFQHGPIDLIMAATGREEDVAAAHAAAFQRAKTLLSELVAESKNLYSRPIKSSTNPMHCETARLMWDACVPFADAFITPMAAVAGSVAQTLLQSYDREGIEKAWINNGGDIAFLLRGGATMRIGAIGDVRHSMSMRGALPSVDLLIRASDRVAGVATSGWGGRSFSLGIADSVTVIARTAAMADAAATMIANAVNVNDPRIVRRPANELADRTDLGDRLVTVEVPPLPPALVNSALRAGLAAAEKFHSQGLVAAAVLQLQGQHVTLGSQQVDSADPALAATRLCYTLPTISRLPKAASQRNTEAVPHD